MTAMCAKGVFNKEVSKDGENDDLEDDASYHEVGANIQHAGAIICSGGNSATSALKNEREYVTGDEDVRVPGGTEARPGLAEADDDMFECEVDAGRNEGRRDDEAANLDLKTELVKGIVPKHDATNVADELTQAAETQGDLVRYD